MFRGRRCGSALSGPSGEILGVDGQALTEGDFTDGIFPARYTYHTSWAWMAWVGTRSKVLRRPAWLTRQSWKRQLREWCPSLGWRSLERET